MVQLVTVFFCQETLSGGEGMEHALAHSEVLVRKLC